MEDQALGVVYLESSLNKVGFKREDEHLLSAMANFAAVGNPARTGGSFPAAPGALPTAPKWSGRSSRRPQSQDAPLLQAQRCQVSILFADISGFTRMSESMEPLALANILNRSFEVLTEQIFLRGGTLDKYIGDAIMAFFGVPQSRP